MAREGMEEAQKERLVTQAQKAREALSAQAGGELSLCVPYEVSTYVEGDDEALYCGGVKGWGQLPHPGGGKRTVKKKKGSRPKSALA